MHFTMIGCFSQFGVPLLVSPSPSDVSPFVFSLGFTPLVFHLFGVFPLWVSLLGLCSFCCHLLIFLFWFSPFCFFPLRP